MDSETLKIICDMVVGLTAIRQKGCEYLCVDNFAEKLLKRMLETVDEFYAGGNSENRMHHGCGDCEVGINTKEKCFAYREDKCSRYDKNKAN